MLFLEIFLCQLSVLLWSKLLQLVFEAKAKYLSRKLSLKSSSDSISSDINNDIEELKDCLNTIEVNFLFLLTNLC